VGSLTVRVLGEFGVEGADLAPAGSRKERLLLRLLALARGRFVRTDLLAEALWGADQPARPADQVAVLASRLRRRLGRERIEHGDDGYRLRYDWLDADQLDTVVAEIERRQAAVGRPGYRADHRAGNVVGAARAALVLARGAPTTLDTDAEWVAAEISALRRLVLKARRVAAVALLESGNWLEAADLVSADLEQDPYDEHAARLLMRANVAGGRPGAALAVYAELRDRLLEELGADPAPETSALHTAVLRGEVGAPVLEAPGIPALRLVGRDAELLRLDEIAERAREGHVEIVVVTGEAGVGKTTLVRAWSARRGQAGDTLISGTCGQLDRSVPLDAPILALTEHLRRLDRAEATRLLGPEASLLAPLLGLATPGPRDLDAANRTGVGTFRSTGAEESTSLTLADGVVGPAMLFTALTAVLRRLAQVSPVLLVIDDAHLSGPALIEWLRFLRRSSLPLVVVAAVRAGEGDPLPGTEVIEVRPLDLASTAQLVGPERAERLFAHSLGNPLFLTELAAAGGAVLPDSLVGAVSARCDELGDAGAVLRAAALLDHHLDLDLLAAVLSRPVIAVLDDVELAARRGLLDEEAGRFSFRHDLVRDALAAGMSAGRSALLHREASRVLARRAATDPNRADPIKVAEHARLGGDLELAARSLREAAVRAAERFDHETSERLLDEALQLRHDDAGWLARARVRTRRGRYAEALADAAHAESSTAEACEVSAWACYFGREFDQAIGFAQDGEFAAGDQFLRARCQIVGARTHHARGDLQTAEQLLGEALGVTTGADRLAASAWLGIVRAHQSRVEEALRFLRPATQPHVGVDLTSATLHALLFTGHAHALAGRPVEALVAFADYNRELARRQVPRFAGRGVNFSGWVLRNIGERQRGLEAHLEALETGASQGTPELRVAALEDLAEDSLGAGDLDSAAARLHEAHEALTGDLVFGWRLDFKLRLLRSRQALLLGQPEAALQLATRLADESGVQGVPRYSSVARLVAHQATAALGEPVDHESVRRDLAEAEHAVAVEAWWWAGETGAALGVPDLVDRAGVLAHRLAKASGDRTPELLRDFERRSAQWRPRVS